jgi:hypothetical protein
MVTVPNVVRTLIPEQLVQQYITYCKETTIFARNYGTAAVISYNLKGIAPPVPPVQCWADKNLMSAWLQGANIETGGGREGGKMYQQMVYYNRMHVKTRFSQSILSTTVC